MNIWVLNNPQVSNADPTSISFEGYFTTLASYIWTQEIIHVSMDFHLRLEQPPMVQFYARVSSRVPFFYLTNKQPNLAFLSGRLTSGSIRSSSVQRSFFRGDVIAITLWAPVVVNLVHPY